MELGDWGVTSEELKTAIQRGIAYLKPLMNNDGGIPNHSPGDPSGAWTTAEVLSTLWQIDPSFDPQWFDRLADYLLSHARLPDGSWPTADILPGSIPGTAASIQALLCIDEFPWVYQSRQRLVRKAIEEAVQWLIENRNKSWGWSWDGANRLRTERPFSLTAFALRSLAAYYNKSRSGLIREFLSAGVEYLKWYQNPDGGWGLRPGCLSAVSNTGRILKLLVSFGVDPNSQQILSGINWLEQAAQDSLAMQVIDEYVDVGEGYLPIVIHHNTPFILLSTLLTLRPGSSTIIELTRWFVESQFSDGSWKLSPLPAEEEYAPSTWVTVEAIYALQKVYTILGLGSGSMPALSRPR